MIFDHAFSWAGSLRAHLKTHTGEKTKECNRRKSFKILNTAFCSKDHFIGLMKWSFETFISTLRGDLKVNIYIEIPYKNILKLLHCCDFFI